MVVSCFVSTVRPESMNIKGESMPTRGECRTRGSGFRTRGGGFRHLGGGFRHRGGGFRYKGGRRGWIHVQRADRRQLLRIYRQACIMGESVCTKGGIRHQWGETKNMKEESMFGGGSV
jgi:hypothetical protein